jgi:hypothetical protein
MVLVALAAYGLVPAGATAGGADHNGFDLTGSLVPADEVHLGGPQRDGIPALDDPALVEATEAGFLADSDPVLGLVLGGEARAYPIAILNWHEIVNDRIAGRPVAITYCPLCGTGVAFDARLGDRTLSFGVSGLLYNSDVLLYDRQTESLWSQIRRQAISGPMKGRRLAALPVTHTTWRAWRREHPGSLVLSDDTGHRRDYGSDPYAGYSAERGLYFPVSASSNRYHPKERVLGVEIDGRYKAYPFAELSKTGMPEIQDRFVGRDLLIRFDWANESATAFDDQGRQLAATTGYWFAWYAFHPDTEVFKAAR